MLQLGVNLSMPDFTQLKPSLLVKLLRFHVPEIADAILSRIEDRTPVDTGALKEDEAVRVLKSRRRASRVVCRQRVPGG
jgi:hypothetical protein